jgi:lysophospholipase L1-like esterase
LGPLTGHLRQRGKEPYDAVLILLGANDGAVSAASSTADAERAIESLRQLHSAVQRSGALSVALGLPGSPAFVESGDAKLKAFNKRVESQLGSGVAYIDMAKLLPTKEQALWSFDRCHLVGAGYEKMGRVLAKPLAKILMPIASRLREEGGELDLEQADDEDPNPLEIVV